MIKTPSRATLLLALTLLAPAALAQQKISKVNGGISVEAGQAYGDVETVNGGITLGDNATVEDAETVNGGIKGGNNVRASSLSTVNGGIRLGTQAVIGGDVETVNGGIFLDRGSQVGGDVETVNGAIGLVGTRLAGGIETVNGDITVGIDSHVKGGIRVIKPKRNVSLQKRDPRVVIGPNAVVEGALVFERPVTLYVHRTARTGAVTGATAQSFDTPTAPVD